MATRKAVEPAKPRSRRVELATRRSLRKLRATSAAGADLWDALEAQAILLAQTLDLGAGLATAGISKELGRVLAELAASAPSGTGGTAGDPLDDFDAALGRPVVVPAPMGDPS